MNKMITIKSFSNFDLCMDAACDIATPHVNMHIAPTVTPTN